MLTKIIVDCAVDDVAVIAFILDIFFVDFRRRTARREVIDETSSSILKDSSYADTLLHLPSLMLC